MTLVKFKQADMNDLYLDMTKVLGVRPSAKNYNNQFGASSGTVNVSGTQYNYTEPGNTVIICENNVMFFVDEHISELIALLEGRDPRPAKVLFGKTTA